MDERQLQKERRESDSCDEQRNLAPNAITKNYRPTKIIWTVSLVMRYRPIAENHFSEIKYPVFTASGW